MKRSLQILIILSFIGFSCSNKIGSDVIEFKRILGNENSNTLSLLISGFENDFLKVNYPHSSIKNAYIKFINDLRNQNTENLVSISKKSRDFFDKSKLKYTIYDSPPDSIWIEKNIIKKTFKDNLGNIDTLESILLQTKTFNIDYILKHKDSIIEVEYNSNELKVFGQYFLALEKIENSNKFIPGYLEYKRASGGFISPNIVAENMLKYNLDYSNYIIKSIVLFEFIF